MVALLLGALVGLMAVYAADKLHDDAIKYGYSSTAALAAAMAVYAVIIAWIATVFWVFVEIAKYVF